MSQRVSIAEALAVTLSVVVMLATGNSDSSTPAGVAPAAHARAATKQAVKDDARLHVVKADGNTLIEEGKVAGNLPGSARVTLEIGTTSASCSFTFYLTGGAITGHGIATLHEGAGDRYTSFGGSASISRGEGRYAHVAGSGGIYGVLNRRNDDAEVQVIGTLRT